MSRLNPVNLSPLVAAAWLSVAAAPAQQQPAVPSAGGAPVPVETPVDPPLTQPTTTASVEPSELHELAKLITGNNTPEARELGARRLLRARSDEAIRLLADILASSGDLAARQAVCRAMTNGDSPATSLIDPLLQLLGEHPDTLDAEIVSALRALDRNIVLKKLQTMARADELLIERRKAAVSAIGRLGEDFSVVAALADLLEDDDPRVRGAAMVAMQSVAGAPFQDVQAARDWWAARKDMSAEEWLLEINQRRSIENQRLRGERDLLASRLLTFARELYQRTPVADQPDQLLEFLRDDHVSLRHLGLDLVNAQITDGREIRADIRTYLVDMTLDADADVRRRVATIVGDLRLSGAVARLRDSILVEPDARVRAAQVAALGRLNELSAVPALLGRLDDSSNAVVGEAAMALGILARPGSDADADSVRRIAEALLAKFETLPDANDTTLRERFIEAMGRIGAAQFRSILKREMTQGASIGVCRAAVLAMAVYGDAAAAEDVRPLVEQPHPEIRLAAIQVLSRCGRGPADLAALGPRLDSRREDDPSVRRKAWDAYQEIVGRMPPAEQLEQAVGFALVGDQPAARRRIVLLRALKNRVDDYERLAVDDRLRLLDALATALAEQNEPVSELKNLDEAIALSRNGAAARTHGFLRRLVEASLRAGLYDHLTAQIRTTGRAGLTQDRAVLLDAFFDEYRRRLERATEAADFSALLTAADLLAEPLAEAEPSRRAALDELRRAVTARRERTITDLLDALPTGPDAETRLAAFGRELVLPRIHGALAAEGDARPTLEAERRLIEFARRLAPAWNGYPPDATSDQKAAALAELRDSARQPANGATSRPASASG